MKSIITLALSPPAVLNPEMLSDLLAGTVKYCEHSGTHSQEIAEERQQYTHSSSSQARQLCPGLLCVWVTHAPRETIAMKVQQRAHMPV